MFRVTYGDILHVHVIVCRMSVVKVRYPLTLKPAAVLKMQALKTHNPEIWQAFKQTHKVQEPLKLSKNYKHHVTHR